MFGVYLGIIFGSTSHEQLLRESPVNLPLLNVELPLGGFYLVAPTMLLLLHLNLLIQLYLLSQKLHRLDGALRKVGDQELSDDMRAQLATFPFGQMLIGSRHGPLMRFLLWLMVWLSVLVLPLVLLLFGQVSFLPYHDAWITSWHRVLVAADVLLLSILWRRIRYPPDRPLEHYRRWLWRQAVPGSVAVYVLSLMILTFPGDLRISSSDQTRDLGDPAEEWLLAFLPEILIDRSGLQPTFLPTRAIFQAVPFLSRNLVVREVNLVSNWPTLAQIEQFGEDQAWQNYGVPINLKGRDLRYGNFERSVFVRADLRNANLEGANLSFANLQYADLDDAGLVFASLDSARLQGADLQRANLQFANLTAANLMRANLYLANLQATNLAATDARETNLKGASLAGASLFVTNLRGISVTGLDLRGAFLFGADLQGADLVGADLRGARCAGADLQGANLSGADFQGVAFEPVSGSGFHFQGAVLMDAHFEGADLRGITLEGADLRGAHFWRTQVDDDAERWALADLREINVNPLADLDAWIEQAVEQIAYEETRERITEQLRTGLRDGGRPDVPRFPKAWQSIPNVMFDPGDSLPQQLGWGARVWETVDEYDEDLAEFLSELACRQRAAGHLTTALAWRALANDDRLFAKHLAARILGADCLPAAELPDDVRAGLSELAAEIERP